LIKVCNDVQIVTDKSHYFLDLKRQNVQQLWIVWDKKINTDIGLHWTRQLMRNMDNVDITIDTFYNNLSCELSYMATINY